MEGTKDLRALTPVSPPEDWMNGDGHSGLVSVIVPTFNRVEMLPETLQSVWNQTYRPIEVIVVDDGSTDGTIETAKKWKASHREEGFRVRLLRQENEGASVARNHGLTEAHGEYIQFLDSDDLLSEQKIAFQVDTLSEERNEEAVTFCNTRFFKDGSEWNQEKGQRMSSSEDPVDWLIDLLGGYGRMGLVSIHAWLTPRRVLRRAGPWRRALACNDDGEYFSRVVLACSRILKTKGTAWYRTHGGERLSSPKTASEWRDLLLVARLREERLSRRADEEQRNRVIELAFQKYLQLAYRTYPSHPKISGIAERWARKRKSVNTYEVLSARGGIFHEMIGWKMYRTLSNMYNNFGRPFDSVKMKGST